MDLERLRIPERDEKPAQRHWFVPVVCVVCLIAGLLIGRASAPGSRRAPPPSPLPIASRLAASTSRPRSFTAGGWIEVSTPTYPVFVASRISERLEERYVKEGDVVRPGQVVARMYDADLKSRLVLAEARHELAKQTLEKLKAGFRKEDVTAAEARAAEAAERVRIAKANYDRSRRLPAGAISAQELDEQLSRLRSVRAAHELAAAELAKMKAGNRAEDVGIAAAKLKSAVAEVELVRRSLSYATIRAPESGKPLRVLEVRQHVGDWVNVGRSPEILALYDPDEMQVRVDVTQNRIKAVVPGGKVEVVTDADRARRYAGTVLRVEPLAVLAKNTITVRIRIDDPDEYLFPEMVAEVTFLTPEKKGAE